MPPGRTGSASSHLFSVLPSHEFGAALQRFQLPSGTYVVVQTLTLPVWRFEWIKILQEFNSERGGDHRIAMVIKLFFFLSRLLHTCFVVEHHGCVCCEPSQFSRVVVLVPPVRQYLIGFCLATLEKSGERDACVAYLIESIYSILDNRCPCWCTHWI
uniref:Uncharacterized protein n=1 Tax=Oryza nivara TaxID=4536 RepID=A0A0E0H8K9_ORYNI